MHIIGPLQGNDDPFDGTQESQRHHNSDGNPDDHMHCQAWLECNFSPNQKGNNDVADNEDGEIGRCVICSLMGIIFSAYVACIDDL